MQIMKQYKGKLSVGLSLFSSEEDYHDYFTGVRGSFERTVRAISLLTENGIHVRVAMIMTPDNFHEIEKVSKLAEKLGAKSFTISPIIGFGRAENLKILPEIPLSAEKYGDYIRSVERLLESKGRFFERVPPGAVEYIFEFGCGAGFKNIVISPSGNVRPCLLLPEEYFLIGNIIEEGIDVFQRDIVKFFMKVKPPNPRVCRGCIYTYYCMPCIARGVQMYLKNPEGCKWGKLVNIGEWMRRVRDGG